MFKNDLFYIKKLSNNMYQIDNLTPTYIESTVQVNKEEVVDFILKKCDEFDAKAYDKKPGLKPSKIDRTFIKEIENLLKK